MFRLKTVSVLPLGRGCLLGQSHSDMTYCYLILVQNCSKVEKNLAMLYRQRELGDTELRPSVLSEERTILAVG